MSTNDKGGLMRSASTDRQTTADHQYVEGYRAGERRAKSIEYQRDTLARRLAEAEAARAVLREALERYVWRDEACEGCCVHAGPEHEDCGLCHYCQGAAALAQEAPP